MRAPVVSRIKVMAGLNIAERIMPVPADSIVIDIRTVGPAGDAGGGAADAGVEIALARLTRPGLTARWACRRRK
ncbi:hypothetical protein [Novosphingobium sp.]|uniref:hypothetical protein n=1 Tax=Novosphingobium sp. TaxID=1874826 RepID=UPI003BAA6571